MRIFLAMIVALSVVAADKDLGPAHPVQAAHWDASFKPDSTTLVGSYTSIIRRGPDDFVAFNNTVAGELDAGLVMWHGKDHRNFEQRGVVFTHRQITDVFGKEGELYPKRRLTRPFITWHPSHGFVGIIHVCADYGPIDGRVYPALIRSKTGQAGTWTYHGKLKGEIWDEFGDPSGKPRWADGGGFFFQPEQPETLNRQQPLANRYVFFSNQYAGKGSMAILFSADGATWYFHRDSDGQIVNLIPMLAGETMIFPHVVRLGTHGWSMFLSDKWPPIAIYRLYSADGLSWQLYGEQPEVSKPTDLMIKNINGWYDAEGATLHGYLSVWGKQADGSLNYHKFHSSTQQLTPADLQR